MIEWALKAQAMGLHIFPVAPRQKVPHQMAGRWGETATNDINQIVHFWTAVDPQANFGVACKPSQLLVIDLDLAKKEYALAGTDWAYLHEAYGPMVDGEALWDEMMFKLADEQPYTASLDTFQVKTGSGGIHLYYWWPESWPKISQASPVKGVVDVRGNGGQYGGYVLGAGSVTEAGQYYELFTGQKPQLAPAWIQRLVAEKPKAPRVKSYQSLLRGGSFSGLVQSVLNAGEGNRNNALLWAARTMCEEGATLQQALETLGPPAGDAGLGWPEVERTIESAYRIQGHKGAR